MWYPTLYVPFISSLSWPYQLLIYAALLTASYFSTPAFYGALGIFTSYFAYKLLTPLVIWGFWLFKLAAWAGFYVHFFILAIGYAQQGMGMVERMNDGIAMVFKELEKLDRRRTAEAEVEVTMSGSGHPAGVSVRSEVPPPQNIHHAQTSTRSTNRFSVGGEYARAYDDDMPKGDTAFSDEEVLSEAGLGNVSD